MTTERKTRGRLEENIRIVKRITGAGLIAYLGIGFFVAYPTIKEYDSIREAYNVFMKATDRWPLRMFNP